MQQANDKIASLEKQLSSVTESTQTVQIPYEQIDASKFSYDKSKILGKGSFGKVYLGEFYKLSAAVKKIKYTSPRELLDFQHEVQTLMYKKFLEMLTKQEIKAFAYC